MNVLKRQSLTADKEWSSKLLHSWKMLLGLRQKPVKRHDRTATLRAVGCFHSVVLVKKHFWDDGSASVIR